MLERVGLAIEVVPAAIDETPRPGETPAALAARLAAEKAAFVHARMPSRVVLGADTVVAARGDILGKPADEGEARAMLECLSGTTHQVISGFALIGPDLDVVRTSVTEVVMRAITRAELAGYVASGEWRGKAGGYAVQGMAAAFIRTLSGSYDNVVGLPLCDVLSELAARTDISHDLSRGVAAH